LIKTSKELQESKERFELAVKGTRAGIYEWSLKDNSIYISSSWKELLGYDEQELNSISINTFISFIHPEDRDRTSHLIDQVLKNLQPYQGETRMRTKSGEYKWFLDSGIVKADADGNASHVIGSLIDIDGRKKAEKEIIVKNNQLAKTNEELDRFVYSASHDMRAPLSSLLGLIHLSEKTSQLDELRLYNSMMKDRIQVMEGFIKEVTDYSRNTRLELSLSKISLANLVRDVVDHLSYSRINIKMKVVVEIESELTITTDPSRVKVILNNLISNAYKYHRDEVENPFIRITAYQSANQVLISIEDNGRGIGREHHHRIFDMFYRASENSEGSGLGLYIVKETLEKLGGDISVHSETGKGSTFTFALPILA
jgi:PAS domain S-box-containing protein